MTPARPFGSRCSGHFRCQPEAGTSLSLRHQRLSFGFSNVRFSHRGDRGLDDRNYIRPASEKDGRLSACVRSTLIRKTWPIEYLEPNRGVISRINTPLTVSTRILRNTGKEYIRNTSKNAHQGLPRFV